MVFESGLLDAGVAIIIAVALATYAKLKSNGWNWLLVGAIFFLFAGAMLTATTLSKLVGPGVWSGIAAIFEVIGLIFAVVGTVLIGYESLVKRN